MTLSLVTSRRVLTVIALAIIGVVQIACGGGGGGSIAPNPAQSAPSNVSVVVSPSTATLSVDASQQFSATVTGTSNTGVDWSVNGVAGGDSTTGTISASGLYKSPASAPSGAVTVTATSTADATVSASSSVKINSPASVSIKPAQVNLAPGGTQQFSATVRGETNTAVSWAVNTVAGGNAVVGTVSSIGLYTAPASMPSPNPVTVSATSVASPVASATASVTIASTSGSLASLSPIVAMQNTQSLTLTVNGSGFNSSSQVQFNGTQAPTTFVSANQVTAQLTSDELAQAGAFNVAVETGSSPTSALSFYVVPAITSHSVRVTAGATAATVNVAAQSMTTTGPQILQVGVNNTADQGGASVGQGSTATLLLVGQKIAPGTYYEVSGNSGDVSVTQPLVSNFTTTTGGRPGVRVNVTVSSTAATGPRNILVTDPDGDVSVFVGGLLVTAGQ